MELRARKATLRMAETFVISRGASDEAEAVFVEVRHEGVSGYGEANPIERYDESADSALAFLEDAGDLLGDDPFALEAIGARLAERPGEQAAKAGLDAALHDLCGKLAGLPVWRLLGLERAGPPTSWTIWLGDPDDMAQRAEKVRGRFKRLKLKLGGEDGLDVERVRAVHGVDELQRRIGHLVVEARLPEPGQPASSGYEGEGYVIVRHPETEVVRDALRQIVDGIRVEMVEAQ